MAAPVPWPTCQTRSGKGSEEGCRSRVASPRSGPRSWHPRQRRLETELSRGPLHALGCLKATCLVGRFIGLRATDQEFMLPVARERGRGREARPARGHLLGRVEPVAQPATGRRVRWWPVVRRVVLNLLVSLGHPRWHGCWADTVRTSAYVNSTRSRE